MVVFRQTSWHAPRPTRPSHASVSGDVRAATRSRRDPHAWPNEQELCERGHRAGLARLRPAALARLDWPLARRLALALAMVAATTAAVWVGVNPFLWREPIERTRLIVVNRAEETAIQQAQFPEYAVHGWAERPWLTISGSLQVGPLAETPLAALVNLPLLALGLWTLVQRSRRHGDWAETTSAASWCSRACRSDRTRLACDRAA